MKIILALLILVTPCTYAQTKLFRISKLDSADFTQFIADKKVIVVGEMHGTTEVPLFVLQLVRQLRKDQKQLTVGLEIPINHQRDIEEYLKTGDFDKLLTLEHFKFPDGRTSESMGQLIKGLREISGLKISCFDIEPGLDVSVNRDSLMGINLSKSYDGNQMIILTGNLHANLKEGYWKPNFRSATFHFNRIQKFDEKLISLNTYFGSGTIWNCMSDGCRERDAGSNPGLSERLKQTNYVGIYEGANPSGYSGFVYFDKVTASKPMVD